MARKRDTLRENKRRANDEWVQITMKSLKYEKGVMTPGGYRRLRRVVIGAPSRTERETHGLWEK